MDVLQDRESELRHRSDKEADREVAAGEIPLKTAAVKQNAPLTLACWAMNRVESIAPDASSGKFEIGQARKGERPKWLPGGETLGEGQASN